MTPYTNAQAIQQIEEGHWEWLHHLLFSALPNDLLMGALLTPLAKDGKHHQYMIGLEGDLLCVWPNLCHPSSTLTHTLTREAEHVRWRAPTEQTAIDHETYCTGQAARDISQIATFVYPMSWADLAAFLAKDRKYRRTTSSPRSSARAAFCQKTGPCMRWCGLDDVLSIDSGMAVGASLWRWKCWMCAIPFLNCWTKTACGRTTFTKNTIPAGRSPATRHWHGDAPSGLARRLPRLSPGPIGMERVRGGLTEYLQRRRANGRKEIIKLVRRSVGRWAGTGSTWFVTSLRTLRMGSLTPSQSLGVKMTRMIQTKLKH